MADTCPVCGAAELRSETGVFSFDVPPNVPGGPIVVPNATWEMCAACGEKILSKALEHSIDGQVYERLGLLSPARIKEIRKCVHLNQTEMAHLLGVGDKTYARWESGRSMHNKSSDNLLRLVEKQPELFVRLEAQRNPRRREFIAKYVAGLKDTRSTGRFRLAAHGGAIDPRVANALNERIEQIAGEEDEL